MPHFKLRHLFALSLLLSPLCQRPAQAMGVSFDLGEQPPRPSLPSSRPDPLQPSSSHQSSATTEKATPAGRLGPLPIPAKAGKPPVQSHKSAQAAPSNVMASARHLTPPPAEALPTPRILPPQKSAAVAIDHNSMGLSFEPEQINTPSAVSSDSPTIARSPQSGLPQWIYEGGSQSLVARVIGSAEGTRTASGQPTLAYYGHTDPGNGVWNLGTFSYQHGARSPEEADVKQLKRLKQQGTKMAKQALRTDVSMSLGEVLNGLDLANQAPRAALDRGGYIERLAQAKQKGMPKNDAIIWARTYAYLDPETQRWDAPGLGNTLAGIQRDQTRRHEAISQAFNSYQAQLPPGEESPTEAWATPIVATAAPITSESTEETQLAESPIHQAAALEFSITDESIAQTPGGSSIPQAASVEKPPIPLQG